MKKFLSAFILAAALLASVAFPATLVLTWTDNSNNETGFTVERALGDAAFAPVANLPANTQTWTDEGLQPLTVYRYRVFAYNAAGVSDPSNIATATTKDDQPTGPGNNNAAPPPDYTPPVVAMLAPGQSLLIIAGKP